MKQFRFLAFLLAVTLLFNCVAIQASAEEQSLSRREIVNVEYFDDGSYCVTELIYNYSVGEGTRGATIPRSGSKMLTYLNGNDVAVWAVKVTGFFQYTQGVSAYAVSSDSEVYIYDPLCTFISKSSSVYGATASASATVRYLAIYTDKTVTLTCDDWGNLS